MTDESDYIRAAFRGLNGENVIGNYVGRGRHCPESKQMSLMQSSQRRQPDRPLKTSQEKLKHNPDNIVHLNIPTHERPWYVSIDEENLLIISRQTNNHIAEILDLFPSLTHLTLRAHSGLATVTRKFQGGYTERVNALLAKIFDANPTIAGITFPAAGIRPMHTATREDPNWWGGRKALADVNASLAAGAISTETAKKSVDDIFRQHQRAVTSAESKNEQNHGS